MNITIHEFIKNIISSSLYAVNVTKENEHEIEIKWGDYIESGVKTAVKYVDCDKADGGSIYPLIKCALPKTCKRNYLSTKGHVKAKSKPTVQMICSRGKAGEIRHLAYNFWKYIKNKSI